MRSFISIILIFFLSNCSFDNKTGLWNDQNNIEKKKDIFKEFKKISIIENKFNQTIEFNNNFTFNLSKPVTNLNWTDIFLNNDNNSKNLKYSNQNKILFKSKKISKHPIDSHKLYENGNLIVSDIKGNIIVFSVNENKIISKFNFYKKRYKSFRKKVNFIVENNIIFAADNLGYFYSYNYKTEKILWAKNYNIPFSSNIKISKDKIITSNQNNNLLIIDKKSGDILKLIPTEETLVKNEFTNNLSLINENILLFLNSFGTLYSIDLRRMEVIWFNNFNQSLDSLTSNLFLGGKIVNNDKIIIISSNTKTYIVNSTTGSIIKKLNFSYNLKPIILNNNIIFLTKNNFLVIYNIETKNMVFSQNILENPNYDLKNLNEIIALDLMVLNNNIFIFFKNSEILSFKFNSELAEFKKLPSKIRSFPIVIDDSILFLNNKNKLVIIN